MRYAAHDEINDSCMAVIHQLALKMLNSEDNELQSKKPACRKARFGGFFHIVPYLHYERKEQFLQVIHTKL